MFEVFTESLRLANLPFTCLLGGLVIYWLFVALGFFHLGEGDAHVEVADAHLPATLEGDAHVHVGGHDHGHDGGSHNGHGLASNLFHFVNIGEVPTLIVLSVLALSLWLNSMIANHYFNRDESLGRALLLLVPNLVLSAVLTRYLTMPFKKLFGALNREYDEHQPLIGRTCTIITSEVTSDFGQAQIETKGAPLLINVRATPEQMLRHGDTGVIVKEDKDNATYYLVRFNL